MERDQHTENSAEAPSSVATNSSWGRPFSDDGPSSSKRHPSTSNIHSEVQQATGWQIPSRGWQIPEGWCVRRVGDATSGGQWKERVGDAIPGGWGKEIIHCTTDSTKWNIPEDATVDEVPVQINCEFGSKPQLLALQDQMYLEATMPDFSEVMDGGAGGDDNKANPVTNIDSQDVVESGVWCIEPRAETTESLCCNKDEHEIGTGATVCVLLFSECIKLMQEYLDDAVPDCIIKIHLSSMLLGLLNNAREVCCVQTDITFEYAHIFWDALKALFGSDCCVIANAKGTEVDVTCPAHFFDADRFIDNSTGINNVRQACSSDGWLFEWAELVHDIFDERQKAWNSGSEDYYRKHFPLPYQLFTIETDRNKQRAWIDSLTPYLQDVVREANKE